jgi:hypothetical protein
MTNSSVIFTVPRDGESYISHILERCSDLIDTKIWQGIEKSNIEAWLTNFHTVEEKYFAAVILDALMYRSRAQTISLLIQLFQRILPDLVLQLGIRTLDPDWIAALSQTSNDPRIRIVPVIRDNDPPTKSGILIARLLKRHLRIKEKWMLWPWQVESAINKGVSVILFLDDFLGTGLQFRRFIRRMHLETTLSRANFIYSPLVAHGKGLENLRHKVPQVSYTAVEILQEQHQLFSEESDFFKDGSNTSNSARQFYKEFLNKHKLSNLGSMAYGYGKLGVVYAFDHATPNASLPLLWLDTENWTPLFNR